MYHLRHYVVTIGLLVLLMIGSTAAQGHAATARYHSGFNDEYVYATTRDLNNMEGVPAGLKLTLFPVTIVLDTVLLPFAVIAGFVT